MKRRDFFAATAAPMLATIGSQQAFAPPAVAAAPAADERRFLTIEAAWGPCPDFDEYAIADSDTRKVLWERFIELCRNYPAPEHCLSVPRQCVGGDELTIDSALLTRAEAMQEAAEANRESLASGGALNEWCVVVEVSSDLNAETSYVSVSLNANGTGRYDRTHCHKLRLVRPTVAELARYAG